MAAAQPIFALFQRDVSRALQERGFRALVLALLAINATFAAIYLFEEFESNNNEITNFIHVLIRVLGAILYAAALLVVTSRAATSITAERARDTWTMVRMTPSKPLIMVVGQIVTAMIPALLLVLAQLPGLVPLFMFAPDGFAAQFALAAGVAVWSLGVCAAWAVLASAYFHRFPPLFFCTLAILAIASGMVSWIAYGFMELIADEYVGLGVQDWRVGVAIQEYLLRWIPLVQMYNVSSGTFFWSDLGIYLCVTGLSALMAVIVAERILRREMDPAEVLPSAPHTGKGRILFGKPKSAPAWKAIPDWMNPIYAIERHHRRYRSKRVIKWAVLLLAAVYLIAIANAGNSNANAQWLINVFILVMAMSLWVTATGVAANHEQDTFGMVALTGLSAWAILRGRFLAGLVSLAPILVFAVLWIFAMLMRVFPEMTGQDAYRMGAAMITMGLCVLLHMSSGLFASMMTRTTREAVVMNALIAVVVHYGLPLLVVGTYFGAFTLVENNIFGLQRWFDPAQFHNDYPESLAGTVSPLFGLYFLYNENGTGRAWSTWAISMIFGAGWTLFFCRTAATLLANDLKGMERRFRPKLLGP